MKWLRAGLDTGCLPGQSPASDRFRGYSKQALSPSRLPNRFHFARVLPRRRNQEDSVA
jgi:hypothetical protein